MADDLEGLMQEYFEAMNKGLVGPADATGGHVHIVGAATAALMVAASFVALMPRSSRKAYIRYVKDTFAGKVRDMTAGQESADEAGTLIQ
jgi:hypothetical protein